MRVAICDDDEKILKYVQNILQKNYAGLQVSTYNNADSLIEKWRNHCEVREDIVIMDIQFERTDGISAATFLQSQYPKVKIIFLTGFLDYATEIFRANPIYFLTKPIDEQKLKNAVDKAMGAVATEEDESIMLMSKGHITRFDANHIIYLESRKRNLFIYEDNSVTVVNMKLGDVEEKLPKFFLRCHQSFCVNMKYIREFVGQEIFLTSGQIVPVSRPRLIDARNKFLKYLGENI